jgi:hypothetical protein
VYRFTPSEDLYLQIDLIGSDFDTRLGIVSLCPSGSALCLTNDDYSGLQSGFGCRLYDGGVTYSAIVTGYDTDAGQFQLNIDQCSGTGEDTDDSDSY